MKKQARHIFSRQSLMYIAMASIGYVCDMGVLIYMHSFLHIDYILATTSGFIVGLIVQFFLSDRFVFGESKLSKKSHHVAAFSLIGLVGLVILNILMGVFVGLFGIYYVVAKILATIFVYIWNYLARKSLYHDKIAGLP